MVTSEHDEPFAKQVMQSHETLDPTWQLFPGVMTSSSSFAVKAGGGT